MTAQARITQADMDRATKSIANAQIKKARIVMDLKKSRIEIIIGESGPPETREDWSDDDV